MTASTIVLLILLAYLAGMLLISRAARRRGTSFQDTIAAPGQTTLLLLAGSAIGGQIGSGFVIGGAEYGAQYGLGGAWYGIGCGLCYFVTVALARFIYTHRFVSLSDYFAQRYRGRAIRLIYSVIGVLSYVSLLAGQLLAGRAIFRTLGISPQWGVILTAVIALIYANIAGLWGVIAVSSLQSAVIFLGMAAALFLMLVSQGPQVLVDRLPASSFQLVPFDSEFWVSMVAPIILVASVNQVSFQSIVSAKSLRAARGGYLLAGLALIPVAFIPPALGMYGRALFPELSADQVFTALLLTQLPAAVAAVLLAAVICAVIATCNSAYLAAATNSVYDIYQGMINPQADSKTCKRLMLAVDAVVCVVGILLALRMNDIIQVLSMGYSLRAAGCLVPFLGGALWKGGTSRGALVSAVVGMAASLGNSLGLFHLPYASITSVLLSAVAYVAVSAVTPEPKCEA